MLIVLSSISTFYFDLSTMLYNTWSNDSLILVYSLEQPFHINLEEDLKCSSWFKILWNFLTLMNVFDLR